MIEVGKKTSGETKLWKKGGDSGLEPGAHPFLSGTDAGPGSGGKKPGERGQPDDRRPCASSLARPQVLPAASRAAALAPALHRGSKRVQVARRLTRKTP